MKLKFVNIPIFIPELACPFQCIFCNQQKISGQSHIPNFIEIEEKINQHLATINLEETKVSIAFFGGSFTALPIADQLNYLKLAQKYIGKFNLSGIRLSTRPDYISKENVRILKDHNVNAIELGAQSLHEEVLLKSGRGHSVMDVKNASEIILSEGITLGLQMMIGLPYDNLERALITAEKIVEFGATETRIYPTLVISGTQLHQQFINHQYSVLSLQQAIQQSAVLVDYFRAKNIKILRLGLHPATDLTLGKDLIAGPYHPSFSEMVESQLWKVKIESKITRNTSKRIEIRVNPSDINYTIGYQKSNERFLKSMFDEVCFFTDNTITKGGLNVSNS